MDNMKMKQIIDDLVREHAANELFNGYVVKAVHFYTDMNDHLLYFRIRMKNKMGEKWIRPFHYNEQEQRWIIGEPAFENQKPLYGLVNLSRSPDATIYVVEGEGKVDLLNQHGLTAVTSGSSSSAEAAEWHHLKGRQVIIWPDNDKAGIKYAADITTKLRTLDCEVLWINIKNLDLPKGGDVIDWFVKNPTASASDIVNLPTIAPTESAGAIDSKQSISYRIASDIEIRPIRWLWELRFARGKLSIITGDPGIGKSHITANMTSVVTNGDEWPDGAK